MMSISARRISTSASNDGEHLCCENVTRIQSKNNTKSMREWRHSHECLRCTHLGASRSVMSAIEDSVSLSNGNVQPDPSKVKLSIVMTAERGLPQHDQGQRNANTLRGFKLIACTVCLPSSWFECEQLMCIQRCSFLAEKGHWGNTHCVWSFPQSMFMQHVHEPSHLRSHNLF